MTITTTITCDVCGKECLDFHGEPNQPAFTLSATIADMELRSDFCSIQCLKSHMLDKFYDMELGE